MSNKSRKPLPGISYIPDPVVLFENENLQRKLSWEFLDFLNGLNDLLVLLQAIKVKHLKTMRPIPFEVIREIRMQASTGIKNHTNMRIFEKNLKSSSVGISTSLENMLSNRNTQATQNRLQLQIVNRYSMRRAPTVSKEEKIMIMLRGGRAVAPLWHSLAKEKQHTVTTAEEEENRKKEIAKLEIMGGSKKSWTNGSHLSLIERRRRDTFSIKFATDNRPRMPDVAQRDIMDAYSAGFTSVESHNEYVNMLEPSWYTQLVKDSIKAGIRPTEEIVTGFHRLSKFFEVNCTSIPQSRAKLCIIIHSLPIWDVTRVSIQRAAEFILEEIFMVPHPAHQLQEWITARHLPYCVVPPTEENYEDESTF